MSTFDFGQNAPGFGFASFSEDAEPLAGPYIPEARDCMSCGMCLRRCPTYQVRREEPYSPRGRIRMIERVLRKNQVLDAEAMEALMACTLCRSCETACPSKMAYGDLYRQTLEALANRPRQGRTIRVMLGAVAEGRTAQRGLNALLRFYQKSKMQRAIRRLSIPPMMRNLRRLESLLPAAQVGPPVPPFNPAIAPECRGEVALFTGCIAHVLDTETHGATINLLTALGYDVCVPEAQTCCGALYAHNGDFERARSCARKNRAAFSGLGVESMIYNSSGCGAFLSEYEGLLNADPPGDGMGPPMRDIMDFLVGNDGFRHVTFREMKARVAVHEPCSQRNVLKNSHLVYELLARIPGLEVVPLPGNDMCCGAGGTKMLTHPELASPPRDEKVQALLDSKADLLISTNLSCALHLSSGCRDVGHEIPVLHPVALLARQINFPPLSGGAAT
ncbi:(Fe-S)-binding protein [Magnetospira thiophila]